MWYKILILRIHYLNLLTNWVQSNPVWMPQLIHNNNQNHCHSIPCDRVWPGSCSKAGDHKDDNPGSSHNRHQLLSSSWPLGQLSEEQLTQEELEQTQSWQLELELVQLVHRYPVTGVWSQRWFWSHCHQQHRTPPAGYHWHQHRSILLGLLHRCFHSEI